MQIKLAQVTLPRFHQEPLLPFAQREKGEQRVMKDSMNDRITILFFYYFIILLLFVIIRGHVPPPFSRSAPQREKGEQIKAFFKFSKIVPLYFSFPFNLPFAERYQRLVNERIEGGRGIWKAQREGNNCKERKES